MENQTEQNMAWFCELQQDSQSVTVGEECKIVVRSSGLFQELLWIFLAETCIIGQIRGLGGQVGKSSTCVKEHDPAAWMIADRVYYEEVSRCMRCPVGILKIGCGKPKSTKLVLAERVG